jgi:hypothetical protein
VDFEKNIIVFTRNVEFFNRTSIMKITLEKGMAEVVAMETMSAMPVKDKVAMALPVIPRRGVKHIRSGDRLIAVPSR